MDVADINYKTLRRIQELEKKSPLLSKIDPLFYKKLSEYLKSLSGRVEKEKDQKKAKLFHEEIHNTEKIAHRIYEQREKKIVQAALSKSRGGTPDLNNMINVEKTLYDSLVKQIQTCRKDIFEQKQKQPEINAVEVTEGCVETMRKETNTNPVVRVMQDMPEFIGTDMKTYHLRKNDVLSLSEDISTPLLKGKVVKKIKT
jgi:DNA replication initiation complex subunit (GINS family)